MAFRSRFIGSVLGLGAVASVAIAGWWWFDVERNVFYTDDDAIQSAADEDAPRDVLWRPPEPLATPEGVQLAGRDPVLSPSGDELLLTITSEQGDSDIYVSSRIGQSWSEPAPLSGVNTIDNELAPSLSADGRRLFFASDRPGGAGGLDVWVSQRENGAWQAPAPAAFNTRDDETDPHPIRLGDGSGAGVLFASNRPREIPPESEETPPSFTSDYDLYIADLGDSPSIRRLVELSGEGDDIGPSVTPSGDFVYFASDRDGGAGGYDLFRARASGRDPTSEAAGPTFGAVQSLGPSINTQHDELDPSMSLEGFAVQFSSDRDGAAALFRAVSREVYLSRTTTRGDLLSLLPWILLALALVLLLAMLRRAVGDGQWQKRLAALSLMAKCVLVSLLLHAGLAALLSALQVPPSSGELAEGPDGMRVALASSALRSSVASQMRGDSGPADLEQAEAPAAEAPAVNAADAPSAVRFEAQASAAPTGTPMEVRSPSRDAAITASSMAAANTAQPAVTEPAQASPDLGMPRAAPAEAYTEAEAGIEAPAAPSAERGTIAGDVALPDAGASERIEMQAAETGFVDSARFSEAGDNAREASASASSGEADSMDAEAVGLPEADVAQLALGTPDATRANDSDTAEIGIEAPAAADAAGGANAPAVESALAAAPSPVRLDAETHSGADTAIFMPDGSVSDAAPSRAGEAPDDALEDIAADLPEVDLPGLALATPDADAAGEAEIASEESVAGPARVAELDPASPRAGIGESRVERFDADGVAAPDEADNFEELATRDADALAQAPDLELGFDLAAPELATPALALPEATTYLNRLIGIVLDDETDEPIADAEVRLDLEGAEDLVQRSGSDGVFELGFDEIPDNSALTANHPDYLPGAINIAERDVELGRRMVLRLRPRNPFVITLEERPEVHHLGNDEFTGRINSQFQRESEGLTLQLPFELTPDHAALELEGAELHLFVKGSQAPNPVRINGRRIGRLAQSPNSGAFGEQSFTIPSGVLRVGENIVELESVSNPGSDKDDFEFVNIRVILIPADEDEL